MEIVNKIENSNTLEINQDEGAKFKKLEEIKQFLCLKTREPQNFKQGHAKTCLLIAIKITLSQRP